MSLARALVVSLHDVSPRTFPACAEIIPELRALGIERTSLLVIPDHHRRGHVSQDTGFVHWLQGLQEQGHEIVLHGYYHERARRAGETLVERFTTRIYTADEGEFFDLGETTAREWLHRGRAELAALGLNTPGFIAPAWLLSGPAECALRALGFDYTTRLRTVSDLPARRTWSSQSLVWSVRSAWRRAVSLRWNALLARRLAVNPLLRVSIHPVDRAHPAIWSQIRQLLARAHGDRDPMTYHAWLAHWRAAAFPPLTAPIP